LGAEFPHRTIAELGVEAAGLNLFEMSDQ
jgi:hypothetical protein